MLVKGTNYIQYSSEMIHQALFGDGLDCSYVGEEPLPDEMLKNKNKKVRKVEELGAGEKLVYKTFITGNNEEVDAAMEEGIMDYYLLSYKKKPSANVRLSVKNIVNRYIENEKEKVKNVVTTKNVQ